MSVVSDGLSEKAFTRSVFSEDDRIEWYCKRKGDEEKREIPRFHS